MVNLVHFDRSSCMWYRGTTDGMKMDG
eukprot:SAG11_NODE_26630_length_342_cov_8.662551_1_plen_26_part_10